MNKEKASDDCNQSLDDGKVRIRYQFLRGTIEIHVKEEYARDYQRNKRFDEKPTIHDNQETECYYECAIEKRYLLLKLHH